MSSASSTMSGVRLCNPPPTDPYKPLSTSPAWIDDLWASVAAANKQPESNTTPPSEEIEREWAPASDYGDDSETSTNEELFAIYRETPTVTISPSNERFHELVLLPRGITVDHDFIMDAHVLFKNQDSNDIAGLQHIKLWLSPDKQEMEEIRREYEIMKEHNVCPEEFFTFTQETLLKGQRRHRGPGKETLPYIERLVQQPTSTPNKSTQWHAPPLLSGTNTKTGIDTWAPNIRAATSYWLSADGFADRSSYLYRSSIHMAHNALCPYLSAVFAREIKSIDKRTASVNEALVVGSMALYNRYRLRCRARAAAEHLQQPLPPPPSSASLNHFVLTFVGAQYSVWVVQPKLEEQKWRGCTMTEVAVGDLACGVGDVERLVGWVNALHLWGTMVHRRECGQELSALLSVSGRVKGVPCSLDLGKFV
ncbi:uncharacterized protein K452DRAFT_97725 [Aplosporella prunicola CBS 121167]|uniref:Uncharacterized protein n=1 Tax=Aplosporella prunicola CBS 121167 TaxID=1176127 RepID=A0A6A6B2V2_9PEZI|nr:uncharacterized protein K452DRAFT_97725 [Aplosporella prunicola CBS 121167]KAF2137713.1 hypothetical protein K452DRAFT_97725 [Aplosporella prunicola CBS 121167]